MNFSNWLKTPGITAVNAAELPIKRKTSASRKKFRIVIISLWTNNLIFKSRVCILIHANLISQIEHA